MQQMEEFQETEEEEESEGGLKFLDAH